MRIWLAMRVFFSVLFNAADAARVSDALEWKRAATTQSEPARTVPERPAAPTPTSQAPARSEALTLLATLQRESRLLDLIQEPLGNYSDAQIGAAARDVLKKCAEVLERLFSLKPGLAQEEGAAVEVPRGYDPQRFRLVGNVSGEPPFRGKLVHPGWVASRCELPVWTGSGDARHVLAPVEVEVGGS